MVKFDGGGDSNALSTCACLANQLVEVLISVSFASDTLDYKGVKVQLEAREGKSRS